MSERKTYEFTWSAEGCIAVRGDNLGEAAEKAANAISQLVTMDAGDVSVDDWNVVIK